MKWLSFVAFLLLVSSSRLDAQWIEPQHDVLASGDFDRPHPGAHRTGVRPFSMPQAGIPNWPFPNVDVTNDPNLGQFELSVAINPLDSNNVIIGLIDDSSFSTLGYCVTKDGGATWSRKLLPQRTNFVFDNATDPSVAFDANGSAYFGLGFYGGDSVNDYANAVGLFRSTDLGADWTQRADAFENVSSDTMSDKYYIAIDQNPASKFSGRIYMSWVDQGEPGYVRIVCAYSSDDGLSWSDRRYLSGLGHYTAPVPVTEPDGTLLIAYVDYFPNNIIYLARSTDGGMSFGSPDSITDYVNVGPMFPDDSAGYQNIGPPGSALGVNSFPSIAIDPSPLNLGRAYMTWCGKGKDADSLPHIWLTTSDNDGITWSAPREIDQDTVQNPSAKFFPWVAVDPSTGNVGIIYYSAMMGSNLSADLYMAHSTDGGESFVTRRITDASFNPVTYQDARHPEGQTLWFFGDYIGLAAKSNTWYPAWCDSRSGDAEIYTSIVQPFAPMPVTDLRVHDTTVNGKSAVVLTWEYDSVTTFGYPLPNGYQFSVAKDDSLLSLQAGNLLGFTDTNAQQGHEYEVTVVSGSYKSITDSIVNAPSGVTAQTAVNSSVRFSNEPAIAGCEDDLNVDCSEACSISVTFYDELGRAIGPPNNDGMVSSHHELRFSPDHAGVRFFVLKEFYSTGATEIVGKLSVIEQ